MEKNCIICNSAFLSNYPKVICCSKICVRKNYYNNNKRKILKRVYAYKKTEKGKLTQKRYGKSSKGRSMQNRWRKSSKGKRDGIIVDEIFEL